MPVPVFYLLSDLTVFLLRRLCISVKIISSLKKINKSYTGLLTKYAHVFLFSFIFARHYSLNLTFMKIPVDILKLNPALTCSFLLFICISSFGQGNDIKAGADGTDQTVFSGSVPDNISMKKYKERQ